MTLNFREILKTLFLCIASVNLGISSGIVPLGVLFALLFVREYFRKQEHRPRYRKLFAYSMIAPCAVWWVLVPTVEFGVSPYVVFIPGWYLLYLALLQKRSLGNGGYEAFVCFDGCAALLLGLYHAPKACVLAGLLGILFAVHSYSRRRTAVYKQILFVLLFVAFCASSFAGWKYWKTNRTYGGSWGRAYYEQNHMAGFDPVAPLGSLSGNYESRYNDQVILRVWDTLSHPFIRAAAYEKFSGNLWRLSIDSPRKIYPSRYHVDYAVFETVDSATLANGVRRVWVQSLIDNFGFVFAAPNAVGVAVKNQDSLDYYRSNVYVAEKNGRKDWYYFAGPPSSEVLETEVDSAFLQVPRQYVAFLDSVSLQMNLPAATDENSKMEMLKTIRDYFVRNFKYSLNLPKDSREKDKSDGLRRFWEMKQGFCEYYATLATLLARFHGIEARYVKGFAFPEKDSGRPYLLYRRHNCHAWVEVLIDGHWMTFDATPPRIALNVETPSWWRVKWESLSGRIQYALHVVRDGEWRKSVDDLQVFTQNVVESWGFYAVLFVVAAITLSIKMLKGRKQKKLRLVSKHAAVWIKKLNVAEKKLRHLGHVRHPGETVGGFAARLQDNAQCKDLVQILQEYEDNRWRD